VAEELTIGGRKEEFKPETSGIKEVSFRLQGKEV